MLGCPCDLSCGRVVIWESFRRTKLGGTIRSRSTAEFERPDVRSCSQRHIRLPFDFVGGGRGLRCCQAGMSRETSICRREGFEIAIAGALEYQLARCR